jgi:tetratricopeptide (TPR) repeat protein
MSRRCLIALSVALVASSANAEPSVWEQAVRPALRPRAAANAKTDRVLAEFLYLRGQPAAAFRRTFILERARKMLENTGATRSSDPGVRFRLGQVYYHLFEEQRQEQFLERAALHFAFVSDSDAPLTMRAEALNDLAICYARLGRHNEEVQAYARALAIEPHTETRSILLANRAEGFMVQGDITNAVRGYRASLRETPSGLLPRVGVTTWWGLAVALDRSGDLDGGLAQIARAREWDPSDERLQSDSWFFVPEYDDSWYAALGHWQTARTTADAEVKREALRNAIASWRSYIDRAPPSDHWLALASLRLRQCEKELELALGKPTNKRPPRANEDDAD